MADPEVKESWRLDLERAAHFDTLAETVREWALDTFGGPERIVGCARHMRREIEQEALPTAEWLECTLAVGASLEAKAARELLAEECADIVILAMGMAAHAGFDLVEAFRKKMLENLDRKWLPPDIDGVIEHERS